MAAPSLPALPLSFPTQKHALAYRSTHLYPLSPFIPTSPSTHYLLLSSRRSCPRPTLSMAGSRGVEDVGSANWLSKASPYQVLGLPDDCSEADIKAAFKAKVKEYHPDVYKGSANAVAITKRVIEAYELLTTVVNRGAIKRKNFDPFEEPECEAEDVFVHELLCIGRGCPYSCVERAPHVFAFASETGCARAVAQGNGGEYAVQLAVGQCPRNCIYYVTPSQREILDQVLERALEGTIYSSEILMLENLLARANFENGRYRGPKRTASFTTEWVDWY